eukprot:360105-Chlamydomonas_euryale.AAC.4
MRRRRALRSPSPPASPRARRHAHGTEPRRSPNMNSTRRHLGTRSPSTASTRGCSGRRADAPLRGPAARPRWRCGRPLFHFTELAPHASTVLRRCSTPGQPSMCGTSRRVAARGEPGPRTCRARVRRCPNRREAWAGGGGMAARSMNSGAGAHPMWRGDFVSSSAGPPFLTRHNRHLCRHRPRRAGPGAAEPPGRETGRIACDEAQCRVARGMRRRWFGDVGTWADSASPTYKNWPNWPHAALLRLRQAASAPQPPASRFLLAPSRLRSAVARRR